MAIAAIDIALWDLKARLLGLPLVTLLGTVRESVPVYGSGGFTSYSDAQLRKQFEAWAALGITRFKMKVGRQPEVDIQRVGAARAVIGDRARPSLSMRTEPTPVSKLSPLRTHSANWAQLVRRACKL